MSAHNDEAERAAEDCGPRTYHWSKLCLKCGHPESHSIHGMPPARGQHEFEEPEEKK